MQVIMSVSPTLNSALALAASYYVKSNADARPIQEYRKRFVEPHFNEGQDFIYEPMMHALEAIVVHFHQMGSARRGLSDQPRPPWFDTLRSNPYARAAMHHGARAEGK